MYAIGQSESQPLPAFLELDVRTGHLTANWGRDVNNAALKFKLMPETLACEVERIINENKALFQEILDGSLACEVERIINENKALFQEILDGSEALKAVSDQTTVCQHTNHVKALIEKIEQEQTFVLKCEREIVDLEQIVQNAPYPLDSQTIEDFVKGIIAKDGEGDIYFDVEPTRQNVLDSIKKVWSAQFKTGAELPERTIQFLKVNGVCKDAIDLDGLMYAELEASLIKTKSLLKICAAQLQEYSENEHVLGGVLGDTTISEINKFSEI